MSDPRAISLPPPLRTALVALLLALHWWLGFSGWLGKGATNDESAHLTAGYVYSKFNDYRLQPENGNLPQRWAALPLLAQNPRLEPAEMPQRWNRSDVWIIANHFLYESGNLPELMLASGRAMIGLLSVAAGLFVFLWSSRLWGEQGGLFSLCLWTFSSTTLAHGFLVTSDMAAALALLVATGAFWSLLNKPSGLRLLASVVLTGLATVSKFSFPLLVPTYLCLGAWRLALAQGPRGRDLGRLVAYAGAHVAGAVLIVWAFYGFRYAMGGPALPTQGGYYFPWGQIVPAEGLRAHLLNSLRDLQLLPEAFVVGLAHVLHASEARGAFAAGHYSITGWWWFFPYAFLIKTPAAELLACVSLAGALLTTAPKRGWLRARGLLLRVAPFAPLLVFPAVYWAAAITSNLNIGHRHLLPVYGPLFILLGALASPVFGRVARVAALLLALGAAVGAVRQHPHHLAHFNAIAGGSENGWRHLVDSSLDWGQELPALADWLKRNRRPDEKLYLSYFGLGDLRHEGLGDAREMAPLIPPWRLRRLEHWEPGLYCISATMLQDVYGPWQGPWDAAKEISWRTLARHFQQNPDEFTAPDAWVLQRGTEEQSRRWRYDRARFARLAIYLRVREPDAVINHVFRVYRLDAREVALARDVSSGEWIHLLEEATRRRGLKEGP